MFGKTEPAKAESTQEGIDTMADATNDNASLSAEHENQVAALQATVAALTEQLNGKAAELADKDSKIAELTALVEAATEFKAAQEKAAAEAKVVARTAKLADVVGTEQAASLQAALASLDDAAFDVAVGAMSNKLKTEENSTAFKEVGVEGSADATKLAAEAYGGKTADYLQAIVRNELK